MSFARFALVAATVGGLSFSGLESTSAQSVAGFAIGKFQNFRQTSSAAPVADGAQPFQFISAVLPGSATLNSGTLTFTGTASPRTYTLGANGDLNIIDTFTTQSQMDLAYGSGNYTLSMNTSAGTFSRSILLFSLFGYPTTPMLTVPANNWQGGALMIDPAFDYTFTWNSFANAQATDVIQLAIRNSGLNFGQFSATQTSFTLTAGSLQPNTTYTADLAFIRLAGFFAGDTDVGQGFAGLVKDNTFTIVTIPEPAPAAMFLIGSVLLGGICCFARRARA